MEHWHTPKRIHLIFFILNVMMVVTPAYSQDESAVALLTGRQDLGAAGNVYYPCA